MPPEDPNSYQQSILDHFEDPYHQGPGEEITHAAEAELTICGDSLRIELKIDGNDVVQEAWFDGTGCIASQAAASMLVEHVEQKSIAELRKFSAMQMLELIGPDQPPVRQRCYLLSWRVLQSALDSPIDDEASEHGPRFGGPSLREEC